jgi:hypothetical protein
MFAASDREGETYRVCKQLAVYSWAQLDWIDMQTIDMQTSKLGFH